MDFEAYLREVAEVFVKLRGSSLFLSGQDIDVARGWFEHGIPLDAVRAGIMESSALTPRSRRARRSPNIGLVHCDQSVRRRWDGESARHFRPPESEISGSSQSVILARNLHALFGELRVLAAGDEGLLRVVTAQERELAMILHGGEPNFRQFFEVFVEAGSQLRKVFAGSGKRDFPVWSVIHLQQS